MRKRGRREEEESGKGSGWVSIRGGEMCASTSCARAVPLKKRRRKNKSAARAVIQPRHDPVGQVRQIRQRQEYFNDARLDEDKHKSFIHLLTRPQRECICKQLSWRGGEGRGSVFLSACLQRQIPFYFLQNLRHQWRLWLHFFFFISRFSLYTAFCANQGLFILNAVFATTWSWMDRRWERSRPG